MTNNEPKLHLGQTIEAHTENSIYRMTVTNAAARLVTVIGTGHYFNFPTPARIIFPMSEGLDLYLDRLDGRPPLRTSQVQKLMTVLTQSKTMESAEVKEAWVLMDWTGKLLWGHKICVQSLQPAGRAAGHYVRVAVIPEGCKVCRLTWRSEWEPV